MSTQSTFDPYGFEAHYSLDMACYFLHRAAPKSVHICTDDPDMAKAAARRLNWVTEHLVVNSADIAQVAADIATVPLVLQTDVPTPAASLIPFSRRHYEVPPNSPLIVVVTENAFSYKSILYPGLPRDNIVGLLRWLQPSHTLTDHVGLFSPGFLVNWLISTVASTRWPAIHFSYGQRAIDRIYSTSVWRFIGYINVISANQVQ